MIRLHRSLYLLSTLFLFQYTVVHYMFTPKDLNNENFDYFELIKSFQMLVLTLFMILVEFRSGKFITFFRFTENPYIKSIFVLIICGLLYDKKAVDEHSQLRILLGCMAVLGVIMLFLAPCSKRTKGLEYITDSN